MVRQIRKLVRPALLLAAIVLVLFWLLGGRTFTWTAQLETNVQPDVIFAHLCDPQRMTRWMSEVIQIDSLNELPPGVGRQTRIVLEDRRGTRRIIESEIVEFDADRLLKLRLSSPRFEATSTFIIEPKGSVYRLQQRLQARYKGLYRFATPFIGRAVQHRLDADLQSLRQLLERPDAG